MSDDRACGGCNRYRPGQPFDASLDCRLCWLFNNDDSYHAMWSGQPPSLLTKAASFGKAVVRHAASGFTQTTQAEYDARLAVCKGCPEFTGNSCKRCGCGLRAKATMRTESCPLGKWPTLG